MRVLFATSADKSIFQSLTPLAWALRTAGHEVRVASLGKFAKTINQAGLTAVPVGRDDPEDADADELLAAAEAEADDDEDDDDDEDVLPLPYDVAARPEPDISWTDLKARYDFYVTWWHKTDSVPMINRMVAYAKWWRPDLVIWDPIAFAGPIAAKAVGAAHARLLWGQDIFGVTREHYLRLKEQQPRRARGDMLADWLGAAAKRTGGGRFTEDMVTGQFTIDQLPESLRLPANLDYVPMRYVPYGGPSTVESWLWETPKRPRVAITLGITAAERFGGYAVGVQGIFDSLADLDIEVVATINANEQKKVSRVPANVRMVGYAPLQALAPTCAAVIHHAGFGTLATTSLHGVPQLALPTDFDEPPLARKLTEQGTALTIHSSDSAGPRVRELLLRVLNEPSFRESAQRLRAEMLAMPSANELVPHLEELTAKHRVTD
ncbi:activator-dependent family glycosyltransferase [Kibdelosporangium phytohabitans]|uniref:Glycosyl transferase n=1 Tax=Kibdelosporangium phytohabitans TaxID=860235 RepID=A0A0N9I4Z6_9PSEU|nr:activator-dependent family glycosyltransferase [Kibdelosporangium phytohabitans]ALG09442.1 glycosyl transferase [Kibdelosporangium phytohabitans]MBE1469271.1 glycosyltransferase (activator-dependent family) [Kibdelosporangium phytohabitans]